MTLRKQIFLSFLLVAMLPLIFVSAYLFRTNVRLAFELYKQNLQNSTAIQADILEDHVNRMMVRAARFAASRSMRTYFTNREGDILNAQGMADEIMKFTDETLDSVAIFTIVDKTGKILYSSGSNSDTQQVAQALPNLPGSGAQYISEISLGSLINNLAVVTPITVAGERHGSMIVVYSNEYFLKTISSHKQVESSNAFIYCRHHQQLVTTKRELPGLPDALAALGPDDREGELVGKIGGVRAIVCYRAISKTPWILANDIPTHQVHSLVWSYGFVSFLVFLLFLVAIVLLSRAQSKRILQPLNRLLNEVEDFFVSGASRFHTKKMAWNRKTEISYLAEKFAGMASDIAAAQEKLWESNYLYEALLHATYGLRITIDYDADCVTSSAKVLSDWLGARKGGAVERTAAFFEYYKASESDWDMEAVREILSGAIDKPAETDVCCRLGDAGSALWFRLIAVPISGQDGHVRKLVLHFEDITNEKQERLRLLNSSQRDPLCGLLNKSAFLELAQKFSGTKQAYGAMFFIDLDHFKEVNDKLGHAAGDEVLRRTAVTIASQFRAADLVARYGGDEFVVYTPGVSRATAERKASILVERLEMEQRGAGGVVHVSGSVGVCFFAGDADLERLIRQADAAMYRAKQSGRSCYRIVENEEEETI